eukprot:s501_g14.t1
MCTEDGLPPIETPLLSSDLLRWGVTFEAALKTALQNLRERTKKGKDASSRWEHHPTGCGESCWKDRFDAVHVAVFPKLVATRKRPDGVEEQGASALLRASQRLCLITARRQMRRFLSLLLLAPAAKIAAGKCSDFNLCLFFGVPLSLFGCAVCAVCVAPFLAVGAGAGAVGAWMQQRGQARQQQPPMPAYNQNYSQSQAQPHLGLPRRSGPQLLLQLQPRSAMQRRHFRRGLRSPRAMKGTSLFRTVHKPRVAIRAAPSTKAEIVHVLVVAEIFKVSEDLPSGWVKLDPEEAWVRAIDAGYVLRDGREIGLGKLIEQLPEEEAEKDVWPYATAINLAAALQVPFQMQGEGLRPQPREKLPRLWLSAWHVHGEVEVPRRLLLRGSAVPRLALAVLLRGSPASAVQSFLLYHMAQGFGLIFLFFDAPNEPTEQEAVAMARGLAAARGGIVVHLCTEDWWRSTLSSSRFALRRRESAFCEETMQLFETVRDVQSRQCLAVDAAAREAQRRGFDWLLHIDSDEALHLPKHADARGFFAELPADVDQVVFNNLEAAPESVDIDDWFKDVSLFKVHQNLLRDTTEASSSKKYLEKLERWRQRQIAKGTDPEDIRTNRSFDSALLPVRIARRKAVQELRLVLPPGEEGDEEPFDSDEEPSRGARKAEFEDLPCYFVAYGNGKAACRLRSPPPLPMGVHRFGSDTNERLRSQRCTGYGAPVILHYANCGYESWRRKYEILASGHGTEDGGFSIERKGIKSMRAHLAHRALCHRGNEEDLAKYYRTYIMGNEFGELPHFACHGLVTRVRSVQRVLREEEEKEKELRGLRANTARQFMVQCPPNVSPGDTLKVTSPDGFDVQVSVPLGIGPGQQFAVSWMRGSQDQSFLAVVFIPQLFQASEALARGGHVVSFATHSCVLASTSKNALGLCFMGDTLHLQLKAKEPKQLLSITPILGREIRLPDL